MISCDVVVTLVQLRLFEAKKYYDIIDLSTTAYRHSTINTHILYNTFLFPCLALQLRDRGEALPPDDALNVAKAIKEQYCYVCPDLVKEYNKYGM
jgi:hypothetical protein